MEREDLFDAFYRSTRAEMLHQTFVLTGDLPAAQGAVREAYTMAWHHWRKVGRLDAPMSWVRPRAWQIAQRRHSARIWHRSKGLSPEHRATLDAVAKLPVVQRRVMLLSQLAGVPLSDAAREAGVTQDVAERSLQSATASLASQLDVDSAGVRFPLASLREVVEHAGLPRASILRRAGRKRRRVHTVLATVAAAAVAVGSGAVAYAPSSGQVSDLHLVQPKPRPTATPDDGALALPTADDLLDHDQIRRLGVAQTWRVLRTSNNTSGDGINTVCQRHRFADPAGLSALVRVFRADGRPGRSAVQTVEISRSAHEARAGFGTTVGWYAGCRVARLQLLKAYRVANIGQQADVLILRVWTKPVTTYSVAVARVGAVTTSIVGRTVGAQPPPAGQITQSLADSVAMLCGRTTAPGCAKTPTFRLIPPPPSGEERGILAVVDLPPVGRIDEPWVGTTAAPAVHNPSATTCDRADFARAGAERTRSRTFLIPEAKVPARFGLSETYGVFGSRRLAGRFLRGVRHTVARCEDRDLSTTVHKAHSEHDRSAGTESSTWELSTEVTAKETVHFRLGFVRVGAKVAELTFAPAPHDDMSEQDFRDLVARAGDRLRELG
jgi:DNA-directed RNA polymerase specialized sigma24 family protein